MKKLISILIVASIFISCYQAPCCVSETITETTDSVALPVDSNVKIGTLDNGIKFYIRENAKPEARAELRLVVNAGSVLETDAQQGLAHLLEHMAFNGTKNFPKQAIIDYLESIGVKFGPDLNAYTSFDETVYMLQVPTDDDEMLKKGFQILGDWAHNLTLEDEEIEAERGVVIEEWRLRQGGDQRIWDEQKQVMFKGSKYANRMPIGTIENLNNFGYKSVREFYETWYRPDLMAVVVVGDFETANVEAIIREYFGVIPTKENPQERVFYDIPDNIEPLISVDSDPEATRSNVSISFKRDAEQDKTVTDYRNSIVKSLFHGMFNARLHELTQKTGAPFLNAWSGERDFGRLDASYSLHANVKNGGISRGLETVLIEAKRVRDFGFTQTELNRQKEIAINRMERIYSERDKTDSGRLVWEYVGNFLRNEPIPGLEFEFGLYQNELPKINLDEINALATEFITDENRVILASSPELEDVEIPTEAELLAIFRQVNETEITAWEDSFSDAPLVANIPQPVAITEVTEHPEIGVTEWILENGVKIVLKPTDFKNDEILFSAFSPGGTSLVSDENYISATTASEIIKEAGIGEFSKMELGKKMAGKTVSVSPSIGGIYEYINGSCSPNDAETAFQLIYQYFNAPRQDSEAFATFLNRKEGWIQNRGLDPQTVFSDSLNVILNQNHFRRRPLNVDMLDEINPNVAYEIYSDRFADASDFTFVFVGNFTLETMEKLTTIYLGNLPSINRNEHWNDNGIEMPDKMIERTIRKGTEPKSMVSLAFMGDFEWSRWNRYVMRSMTDVLKIRLRETLREEMGGTYGVWLWSSPMHFPDEEYRTQITFGCDPENVEVLIVAALGEIRKFQDGEIDPTDLEKVKEAHRRERETKLQENRHWKSSLQFSLMHDEALENIITGNDLTDKITVEDIQQAMNQHFDLENFVKAVLMPE
ncbi:insulinase family protein [bacterium]|nr:insulinase family protein [bacterium]